MTDEGVTVTQDQAQYLTQLVHKHVYPAEYARIHYDNGRRFEVIVREFKRPDDTQPMKRIDEDDLIS